MDDHGQESVQTIERKHAVQRRALEDANGATGVLEVHAKRGLAGPAGDLRGEPPQQRILPSQPHAADEIDPFEFADHARQVGGVVLQIAVEGGQNRAGRGLNARPERGALAGVANVLEPTHTGVQPPSLLNLLPGAVVAGVVHKHQLVSGPDPLHGRRRFPGQGQNVPRFVENRDDDGDFDGHGMSLVLCPRNAHYICRHSLLISDL